MKMSVHSRMFMHGTVHYSAGFTGHAGTDDDDLRTDGGGEGGILCYDKHKSYGYGGLHLSLSLSESSVEQ